jgi:ABC-type glutathione transport system ATPase component
MVLLQQAGGPRETGAEEALQSEAPLAGSRDDSMVEVHDLERRFGKFVAVDHASFSVKRGEIFGLLGPNGAGKTTTFRMLCGLLPPSGGTLTVAGVDVRRESAAARQHLGYVAQKFSLYGQLSVGENLAFFARAYGLGGDKKTGADRMGPEAVQARALRAPAERAAARRASSSAWPWLPPSFTGPRSFSSTSRPAAPTPSPAASSGSGSRCLPPAG